MGTHDTDGRPVVVALPAQIDLTNAERVYDQLYAALISGAAVIIADFTATTFCDSAGMHRLIMIHKRAAARNAQLRLVVPAAGSVRRVLELLGIDQRLPVYYTVPEAAGLLKDSVPEQSSSCGQWREKRGTTP